MNKKLSLLLASGIISAAVIMNGGAAEASILMQSSDAAIIDTYGFAYETEVNHFSGSSLSKMDKCYQKFEASLKNADFNAAELFFAAYIKELRIAQQKNDKSEFNKSYNHALSSLREISNKFPRNAYPKCFLSTLYKIVGDYDEAFELIRDCLSIDRKNLLYKYELANLYMDTNQFEKAIRIYEQLQNQYPREKIFRTALANAYMKTQQYDKAVKEYRVAASFTPDDKDVVSDLVTASSLSKLAKKYPAPVYEPVVLVSDNDTHVDEGVNVTTVDNHNVVMFGKNPVPTNSSMKIYTTTLKDAKNNNVKVRIIHTDKTDADNVKTDETMYEFSQPSETPELVKDSDNIKEVSQKNTDVSKEKKASQKSVYFLNNGQSAKVQQAEKPVVFEQKKNEQPIVNIKKDVSSTVTTEVFKNEEVNAVSKSDSNDKVSLKNSEKAVSNTDNVKTEEVKTENVSVVNKTEQAASAESDKSANTENIVSDADKSEQVASADSDKTVKTEKTSKEKKSKKKEKKNKNKKKLADSSVSEKVADSAADVQSKADNTEVYLKANELLAQNQYQQVIDLLETINPPTLRSLTSIASCHNALGNTDAAIEYYNKADKISPDNSQILFSLAYLYFSKNDIDRAENYLNHSLQADPNNANAIQLKDFMAQQALNEEMNKAISLMNSGNYTESKTILEELAKKDSSNFQVYYYLGHVCYATQKYSDAVLDFLKSIRLNSEYALSYYSLGLSYDKLKKFSDSLASYEKFVQMENVDNKYTQYAKTRINTIKAN